MSGKEIAAITHMLIDDQRLNDLTGSILGAAIEVHRELVVSQFRGRRLLPPPDETTRGLAATHVARKNVCTGLG